MEKLVPRFGALIITFLLGVGLFTFLETQTESEAKLSLDDEWHRLYEAAAMSGNDGAVSDVRMALMCAHPEGIPGGKLIDNDGRTYCFYRDAAQYDRGYFTDTDYYRKFMDSHLKWSIVNIDFLRSIGTKDKARVYFAQHRSLIR